MLGRKLKDVSYIERNTLQFNKAEENYLHV